MASLVTVSTQGLRAILTKEELALLPGAVAGGDGAAADEEVEAWLGELLRRAAARVAGAVNACRRNPRIDPAAGKVPRACELAVYVIARHEAIAALPAMADTLEGASRAAEYRQANDDLARIASCEIAVDDYAGEDDEAIVGSAPGLGAIGHEAFRWMP